MLSFSQQVADGSTLRADVCIVGTGPAGITVANELAGTGLKVLLLESGLLEADAKAQSLNEGESTGIAYDTSASRLRLLGGTSNHWGGAILPLDESDFEARPWLPRSGWPITFSSLLAYYARAERVLKVEGRLTYGRWRANKPSSVDFLGPNFRPVIGTTNPVRFGTAYREMLEQAPNVTCMLDATVLELLLDGTDSSIERVLVTSMAGPRFFVRARCFVLATGGLENARLLLLSNSRRKEGLGNAHGHVGRYFQEHVGFFQCARLIFNNSSTGDRYKSSEPWFSFSEEFLTKHRLMSGNIGFRASEVPKISRSEKLYGRFRRWLFDEEPRPMSNVYWAERDILPFDVTIDAEQSPNPDSRVTLAATKDYLGQQRLSLNWVLSEFDRDNIIRKLRTLGTELGRLKLGGLWIRPRVLNEKPFKTISTGAHHVGTTRMSARPEDGVVDADCRVHGIPNLFVAGSSVFPTSGRANPTFTIVALAIRTADKIKEVYA